MHQKSSWIPINKSNTKDFKLIGGKTEKIYFLFEQVSTLSQNQEFDFIRTDGTSISCAIRSERILLLFSQRIPRTLLQMLMKIYSRVTDSIDYKPASVKQLGQFENILNSEMINLQTSAECFRIISISATLDNRMIQHKVFPTLTKRVPHSKKLNILSTSCWRSLVISVVKGQQQITQFTRKRDSFCF